MKISTKSWHYRLIDRFDFNHPENLCAYFWKTVWACVFAAVLALGAVMLAWIVTAPIWHLFFNAPEGIAGAGAGIDAAALSIALAVLVTERRKREREDQERRGEIKPTRPPSLLRLWLRAKHEKVCPMLEFKP